MGTLTQLELLEELSDILGNRDDVSDARKRRALNSAQVRIARVRTWNELRRRATGVIGDAGSPVTDKYETIPVDTRKVYSFRIVDTTSKQKSRKLTFVPQNLWDERVPETESWTTGTPEFYTVWNKQFEFFKIPDTSYNYEVRYSAWPSVFTSGAPNAVSDLDEKDDMIITLAASWIYTSLREEVESNRLFVIYQEMLKAAELSAATEYENNDKAEFEFVGQGTSPWLDPFNRG